MQSSNGGDRILISWWRC